MAETHPEDMRDLRPFVPKVRHSVWFWAENPEWCFYLLEESVTFCGTTLTEERGNSVWITAGKFHGGRGLPGILGFGLWNNQR